MPNFLISQLFISLTNGNELTFSRQPIFFSFIIVNFQCISNTATRCWCKLYRWSVNFTFSVMTGIYEWYWGAKFKNFWHIKYSRHMKLHYNKKFLYIDKVYIKCSCWLHWNFTGKMHWKIETKNQFCCCETDSLNTFVKLRVAIWEKSTFGVAAVNIFSYVFLWSGDTQFM